MLFTLRLFVNNIVPAVGQLAADYLQPAGSWYSPILLNAWGVPFVNPANQAEIDEIVRTWTASGTVVSESVYGYYVVNPGGILVWSELAPSGPIPMNTPGNVVSLTPRLYAGALC